MKPTTIQPNTAGEILQDYLSDHGTAERIADHIDEIIFDWITGSNEAIQDWHKDRVFTLKTVRDLFVNLDQAEKQTTAQDQR